MNTSINDDIKSGEFKKAYLLYGDEDYLKKNFKDRLLKALVEEGDTMNYSYYEGDSIDLLDVKDVADTMPFFSERRVIHIEDSGLFNSSSDDVAKFAEYLVDAPDYCIFIFVESSIDKRRAMFKAVDSLNGACEMTPPNERQLGQWIASKLKPLGKTMNSVAYTEFMERTSDSMNVMATELEKLIAYSGDREEITRADVDAIVTVRIETKVFDMINSMVAGNLKDVLKHYHDMLAARESAMKILAIIVKQFRQMLTIKEMYSRGESIDEIADRVKIKDFFVKKNLNLSRDMSVETMKSLLRDAADYEKKFKSGQLDENLTVELLMIKYVKG